MQCSDQCDAWRTDFQQGGAALLYRSMHERLFTLAGSTQVHPGQDYKGRDMRTVEEGKCFNPLLTKTEDELVDLMTLKTAFGGTRP